MVIMNHPVALNLAEAKQRFSELVNRVAFGGATIVILRRGKPLARLVPLGAARSVDDAPADVPRMAALAKARASETFVAVANDAIQMHGGIGMTDEHDIGLYLKRARAAELTLGDAPFHRKRWAELSGY